MKRIKLISTGLKARYSPELTEDAATEIMTHIATALENNHCLVFPIPDGSLLLSPSRAAASVFELTEVLEERLEDGAPIEE